jgi:hypothetical protein
MIRTYSELISLPTYEDRFRYLNLVGRVGQDTFGFDRYFNQLFYRSREWKQIRNEVIARDNGCDLAIADRPIFDLAIVHHMNPISIDDIRDATEYLLNPEYLITTTKLTHDLIHYGSEPPDNVLIERKPNDTCPWKI